MALWIAVVLGLLASPALAQPITVTAGEHSGFTRIVLNASRGFGWNLTEGGTQVTLTTEGRALRLDPSRSLDRIPRLRVADLRVDGSVLRLSLACPCPTRIFEDRPGVLVLDVLDPAAQPVGPSSAALPPQPPVPRALDATGLRDIGRALALTLAAETASLPDAPADSEANPDAIADSAAIAGLSRLLAMAMTQGLVAPPDPIAPQPGLLGPMPPGAAGLPDLPANLRLRNASDAAPREPDTPPPAVCPPDETLAFATALQNPSFTNPLATLNQRLFGEFDTPDPQSLIALIEHYLAWGFGAEARLLLDTATVPLPGRDVLSAIADIVEGRQSNARQRLAALRECPGTTALFATLAAAGTTLHPEKAEALAVWYQRLTPSLRAVLGPELIDTLLARGTANATRIALEAFRHAVQPDEPELVRLTAALDQIRNDPVRAEQRLGAADPGQIGPMRLRLEIAVAERARLGSELLADAVALAATQRREEQGRRVMELVILHQAQSGRIGEGFGNLDIFAGWLDPSGSATARVEALRDRLWQDSLHLADAEFLDLILSRDDWRSEARKSPFLLGLAQRFDALGLEALAHETRQRSNTSALTVGTDQGAARAAGGVAGTRPAEGTNPRERAQIPSNTTEPVVATTVTAADADGSIPAGRQTREASSTPNLLAIAETLIPAAGPVLAVPAGGDAAQTDPAPGVARSQPESEGSLPAERTGAPAMAAVVGAAPVEDGGGADAGLVSPREPDLVQPLPAPPAPDAMTRGVAALAETERLRAMLADLNLQRR